MCFAPQRRAFFRHRNFQKGSANSFQHFQQLTKFGGRQRCATIFSDAFVGGRLARANKWKNVFFWVVVSTFQRFVNDWHFHHVHVWTICRESRMPTSFNICNNVTWNGMNHFWGTIVLFTFFSACGCVFFRHISHVNLFHNIVIMFMFQKFVQNYACQPIPTCQQFSELGGRQRFATIFRMRWWLEDWWESTNGNL